MNHLCMLIPVVGVMPAKETSLRSFSEFSPVFIHRSNMLEQCRQYQFCSGESHRPVPMTISNCQILRRNMHKDSLIRFHSQHQFGMWMENSYSFPYDVTLYTFRNGWCVRTLFIGKYKHTLVVLWSAIFTLHRIRYVCL